MRNTPRERADLETLKLKAKPKSHQPEPLRRAAE